MGSNARPLVSPWERGAPPACRGTHQSPVTSQRRTTGWRVDLPRWQLLTPSVHHVEPHFEANRIAYYNMKIAPSGSCILTVVDQHVDVVLVRHAPQSGRVPPDRGYVLAFRGTWPRRTYGANANGEP